MKRLRAEQVEDTAYGTVIVTSIRTTGQKVIVWHRARCSIEVTTQHRSWTTRTITSWPNMLSTLEHLALHGTTEIETCVYDAGRGSSFVVTCIADAEP